MRRLLALISLLLLPASVGHAQGGPFHKAAAGGAIVLSTVAEMMIATGMCTLGDREDWQKVIAAADRRYRFCASKDQGWSVLLEDFKEAEKQAEGTDRSWGSFAVDRFLATRTVEARKTGAEAFCAKLPWKLILVPGADTQEARDEYKKANPDNTLDSALAFFGYVRKLGIDTAWVEAPCDKDFWPAFR